MKDLVNAFEVQMYQCSALDLSIYLSREIEREVETDGERKKKREEEEGRREEENENLTLTEGC